MLTTSRKQVSDVLQASGRWTETSSPSKRLTAPISMTQMPTGTKDCSKPGSSISMVPGMGRISITESMMANKAPRAQKQRATCQPDRRVKVSTLRHPGVIHVWDRKISKPATRFDLVHKVCRASSCKSSGDHRQRRPKLWRVLRSEMPRMISVSTSKCFIFSSRLVPDIGFISMWPPSCVWLPVGRTSCSFAPPSSSSLPSYLWETTSGWITSFGPSSSSSWQQLAC
mmetsp:Transcript_4700/g.11073  ORF Transcript_4700/g.11073 Transcript_4700/m.11073 type:complete len:227 (+) Transcript_4700:2-682(+)